MKSCTAAAVLLLLCSSPTLAQPVLPEAHAQWRANDKCTYARCALSIAPAWNGLDVVSGSSGTRVTGLGFFWPRRAGAPFCSIRRMGCSVAPSGGAAEAGAVATQPHIAIKRWAIVPLHYSSPPRGRVSPPSATRPDRPRCARSNTRRCRNPRPTGGRQAPARPCLDRRVLPA